MLNKTIFDPLLKLFAVQNLKRLSLKIDFVIIIFLVFGKLRFIY